MSNIEITFAKKKVESKLNTIRFLELSAKLGSDERITGWLTVSSSELS